MKVLLLGGTGVFGKSAAALLAREKQIAEIALASRHLETAQRVASEIGDKARAVCVDIKDPCSGAVFPVHALGPVCDRVPSVGLQLNP